MYYCLIALSLTFTHIENEILHVKMDAVICHFVSLVGVLRRQKHLLGMLACTYGRLVISSIQNAYRTALQP